MGLCYKTSTWADRLWSSHVKQSRQAQAIVSRGEVKQGASYSGFASDLHSRLYLNNEPDKLNSGPDWASKLHESASDLAEWRQLKSRCRHDGFAAGVATEAILSCLSDQIPDSSDSDNSDPDTSELPYTDAPVVPGQASGPPAAWTDQSPPDDADTRQALRRAVRAARDAVVEIDASLDGLQTALGLRRPGTAIGEQATYQDIDKIREAHRTVSRSRNLQQIAELAGRFTRLAATKQRNKVRGSVGAVKGVELSGDLSRVLPSELAGLRGSRYERLLTLAKLVDKRALSYRLEAKETEARGPVVICTDLSSSMRGSRDLWAKACTLAILSTATRQRRACTVLGFDRAIRHTDTIRASDTTADDIDRVLSHAPRGGTDYNPPLTKAADIIETDHVMSKADIILITDGEAYLDTEVATRLQSLTTDHGVNIYVIAIGNEAREIQQGPLSRVATRLAVVESTALDTATDPVVFESVNLEG